MIVITQVRLTSHFLGEMKPDNRDVRRFKTDARGNVLVNQNSWIEDLVFAARTLKLDCKVTTTVHPPAFILPASVHLHRRVYSGAHVEFFESFRKGTVLTFEMQLSDELPKCPTLDQLRRMLEVVGEYRGISQWGKKFGFGRFVLLSIKDRFQPEPAAAQVESAGSDPATP